MSRKPEDREHEEDLRAIETVGRPGYNRVQRAGACGGRLERADDQEKC